MQKSLLMGHYWLLDTDNVYYLTKQTFLYVTVSLRHMRIIWEVPRMSSEDVDVSAVKFNNMLTEQH